MPRLKPKIRRTQILDAAIAVAKRKGYQKITREDVAAEADTSEGLVTHYYGTMRKLRTSVLRAAVKREIPEIVGQGLASKDPIAAKASDELKRQAVETLI